VRGHIRNERILFQCPLTNLITFLNLNCKTETGNTMGTVVLSGPFIDMKTKGVKSDIKTNPCEK
jgi:hypothetical protein